jgi:hypothetical protein
MSRGDAPFVRQNQVQTAIMMMKPRRIFRDAARLVQTRFPALRAMLACAMMTVAAGLGLVVSPASAAPSIADDVGLTALIKRLGAGNQPTGAGINVGQVEAPESPGNAYPNAGHPEFAGKIFTPMSGALGVSAHATIVGQNFYGTGAGSIAPGIPRIYMYEANNWITSGHLNASLGGAPLLPPSGLKVFNNSWIADAGGFNNEVLRRADFAIDRDDILMVNGLNNGGPQSALMALGYNGLAVGRSDGGHTHLPAGTPATVDGSGRQKPEILAPHTATSWSAGIVSGAVALMYQTVQTGALASNPNARKSEVIKAALLAGANHGFNGAHPWSNNPATSGPTRGVTATPLDPVYGADTVNVDRSHLILTGGERNGVLTIPTTFNGNAAGWDFASMASGSTLHYRFRTSATVDKVSILATWHREVPATFALPSTHNFTLELRRLDAASQSFSLVGNSGLPYFGGGNVVSQSAVDNLEHLYLTNLVAGTYDIELRRVDGLGGNRDVAIAWIMPQTPVLGDANGDGVVDADDLVEVILTWGACPAPPAGCPADFNGTGFVDSDDLVIVILNWG